MNMEAITTIGKCTCCFEKPAEYCFVKVSFFKGMSVRLLCDDCVKFYYRRGEYGNIGSYH
jgi:hypothetical protein